MDIIEILKTDYQRFPENQNYGIYSENVYFRDPLNQFRGIERYQKMIGFLRSFFQNIKMELHSIEKREDTIHTEWTLCLTSPLPWKPRLSIIGRSELTIDRDNLIASHIDYWHSSPWDVIKQNFVVGKAFKN
jgi:hypothetical protein